MKGNEFVESINRGWPQVGKTFIIVAVMVAALVLIAVAVIEMVRASIRKRKEQDKSLSRFFSLCSQKGFSNHERDRLLGMVRSIGHSDYDEVFESAMVFENAVDAEMERVREQRMSEQAQNDAILDVGRIREKLGYDNLPIEKACVSTRQVIEGQIFMLRAAGMASEDAFRAKAAKVNELEIGMRIEKQGEDPIVMKVGDRLTAQFHRGGDAVYSFETRVATVRKEGDVHTYGVSHSRQLQRKQLRNNVRLDVQIPVKFRVLQSPAESFSSDQQQATSADVSGGGMSFIHSTPLHKGDVVSLNFDLPTGAFRGVVGKVLRVAGGDPDPSGAQQHKHHIQFHDIDRQLAEKIIRFIFEKQREENQWR